MKIEKNFRLLLFFTILSLGYCIPVLAQESDGYKLVWSDEFDVDGSPSSIWSYERGFVRNNELQWYQPENARVENGCLVIEARRDSFPNPRYRAGSTDWRRSRRIVEYTSSCLTTRGQVEIKYGRVEVRAKIPVSSGSWPAIWLLGTKYGWPENGEIDMMEFYRKNGVPSILANACWGGTKPFTAIWDSEVVPLSKFTDRKPGWENEFHIWRMDWDSDFIHLYLDEELLNEIELQKTVNGGVGGNVVNPFSNSDSGHKAYILLNLAIGSNGGEPDVSAFPMSYLVDYVRVWQK